VSAALTIPAPTPQPDPARANKRASGAVRFANFLRSVINCGKELLIAVRQRAHRPDFPRFAKPFGTTYLPHILRRIDAAVRRAAMLEVQTLQQAGVLPSPLIRDHAPSPRKTRPARRDDTRRAPPAPPRSKRTAPPARRTGDPRYADWPSTEQLAAEISRRPIADVLVGICRDLGITPHHPLWGEMCHAISVHGGSVEALEKDAGERWCSRRWLEIPFTPPRISALTLWPAPWSHPVTAAAATGPP
jgi:hypothetical protein